MLMSSLLSFTYLSATVLAAKYSQSDSYQGEDFLSGFTHWDTADPTHGRVYESIVIYARCKHQH